MHLAIGTHVMLAEWSALGGPVVLGTLAAFVAWGRTKSRPITERAETAAAA